MRKKAKTISEMNHILNSSDFVQNEHSMIIEHLERGECPYCANPLIIKKGRIPQNSNVLIKSSCLILSNSSKSKHTLQSCNIKNSEHLIIKDNDEISVFVQTHGNLEDSFVFDEE